MTGTRLRRRLSADARHALNAICPYFTMFPLEFPMRIMERHRQARVVLAPGEAGMLEVYRRHAQAFTTAEIERARVVALQFAAVLRRLAAG